MSNWILKGYLDSEKTLTRLKLDSFPYTIGRNPESSLSINSSEVSRNHATIKLVHGKLVLLDHNSTNGTFINHGKINSESEIVHGDVLHFADKEFRLIEDSTKDLADESATQLGYFSLPNRIPIGIRELQDLINNQLVEIVFQPIIATQNNQIFAYESLGRGLHSDLPQNPGELFRIAESAGMAVELSELFRIQGMKNTLKIHKDKKCFMNTHPLELENEKRLINSLQVIQEKDLNRNLVLEIHEQAVVNLDKLKILHKALKELGIDLAYDDFGAGQSRLKELLEYPPDYIKFDISLIRGIDNAEDKQINALKHLLELGRDLDVTLLAEGVSNKGEDEVCRQLGFDLIQGFYYGRPG